MLTRILAAMGALWGGGILLSGFLGSGPEGNAAYGRGQAAGFIFGAVLFGVGMFSLIKGGKKSTPGK